MRWMRGKVRGRVAPEVAPAAPALSQVTAPGPVSASVSARGLPRGDAILVGLAGATVVAFGLSAIRSIAGPVLLALILTICVHPLRTALERKGVPRALATGSGVVAVFLVLTAFMTALVLALAQFSTLLGEYAPDLDRIGQQIGDALVTYGVGADEVQTIASGFDPTRIADFVSALLGGVAGLTGNLIIVATTLLVMAVDASYLPTLLRQAELTRPQMVDSFRLYARSVRRYMVATTALGLAQGLLNAAGLVVLGVPGAALWGVLSFVASFIPNLGYLLAIIPPVIFGFLVGGWETAIAVVVYYTLVNAIVQGAIQTVIVSNVVALSQTITFVSVLFWATVIGPIGALLATPLTLLVRMILVDSDTSARQWRPLLGDVAETRAHMKAEHARQKAARRALKLDGGQVPKSGRSPDPRSSDAQKL